MITSRIGSEKNRMVQEKLEATEEVGGVVPRAMLDDMSSEQLGHIVKEVEAEGELP